MEAMIEIAAVQALGILEHPAEPEDLDTAASIWRLALMEVIMQLPRGLAHTLCTRPHGCPYTETN